MAPLIVTPAEPVVFPAFSFYHFSYFPLSVFLPDVIEALFRGDTTKKKKLCQHDDKLLCRSSFLGVEKSDVTPCKSLSLAVSS